MTKNVLIFEDSINAISEITFLLGKLAPSWKIVGIGTTINQCYNLLETINADIIFSDIHFGDEVVFDNLPQLTNFEGSIVFVSADNGFASQSFQLSAIDYLLKPINEILFHQMLLKLEHADKNVNIKKQKILLENLTENTSTPKRIAFDTNIGLMVKQVDEIIYAKADGNYTEIYFKNGEKILIPKTILIYEKMLAGFNFIRIHQSYLVNFQEIIKFDKGNFVITLKSGINLPVSHRKRSILLKQMHNLF
jgi:two-component system, LytTR family, response regulator